MPLKMLWLRKTSPTDFAHSAITASSRGVQHHDSRGGGTRENAEHVECCILEKNVSTLPHIPPTKAADTCPIRQPIQVLPYKGNYGIFQYVCVGLNRVSASRLASEDCVEIC
jgi:hypothetical protein